MHSFPPGRHLSSSRALRTTNSCLRPPPPTPTSALSADKAPKGRQEVTGSGIDQLLLSHKTFHLPLSMMASQCLIFTCGNKLVEQKSASMTTWAMISSDAHTEQRAAPGKLCWRNCTLGTLELYSLLDNLGDRRLCHQCPNPPTIFSAWGCCRASWMQ